MWCLMLQCMLQGVLLLHVRGAGCPPKVQTAAVTGEESMQRVGVCMCGVWLLCGIACAAPALCFAVSVWGRVCDTSCLLALRASRCHAWRASWTLQDSGLGSRFHGEACARIVACCFPS